MEPKITITAVDHFKPYQYSCYQQDRQNKTVYINGFQKGEKVEKKAIHGRTAHCSYGKRFPVTPRNRPAGRGCVKTSDEDQHREESNHLHRHKENPEGNKSPKGSFRKDYLEKF